MVVIVINVDAIAIPLPIAAVIQVVRGYHPIRIVVENDVAGSIVNPACNEDLMDALIVAVRIAAPGHDAVMVIVPITIVVAGFLFFPAFVLAIVAAVIAI